MLDESFLRDFGKSVVAGGVSLQGEDAGGALTGLNMLNLRSLVADDGDDDAVEDGPEKKKGKTRDADAQMLPEGEASAEDCARGRPANASTAVLSPMRHAKLRELGIGRLPFGRPLSRRRSLARTRP